MKFFRVSGLVFVAAVLVYALPVLAAPEFAKREDGLHAQAWFKNLSFLELRDDLAEARQAGKGLVIIFEQKGCGSCKRLHEINFSDKKLVKPGLPRWITKLMTCLGDSAIRINAIHTS
jgi:thioredoxin-related protein